jgi:hypothetical protein
MTFTPTSVIGGAETVAERARLPDRRCRAPLQSIAATAKGPVAFELEEVMSMNHHPQDRASAADFPPELLRRLREVEQSPRESATLPATSPIRGPPQDGTSPQPGKPQRTRTCG